MSERKYTKIPNDLLEALIRANLSGRELRYVLFIVRKTYGYHKPQDWIANKQFVKAMGISRAGVSDIQKALILRKIVLKSKNKIMINDNFGLWNANQRSRSMFFKTRPVLQMKNQMFFKRTPTKESITKESIVALTTLKDYFVSLLKERGLTYAGGRRDSVRLAEVLAKRSPDEIKEIFQFYLGLPEKKGQPKVLSINACLSSYVLALFDQEKSKRDWQYAK